MVLLIVDFASSVPFWVWLLGRTSASAFITLTLIQLAIGMLLMFIACAWLCERDCFISWSNCVIWPSVSEAKDAMAWIWIIIDPWFVLSTENFFVISVISSKNSSRPASLKSSASPNWSLKSVKMLASLENRSWHWGNRFCLYCKAEMLSSWRSYRNFVSFTYSSSSIVIMKDSPR